MEYDGMLWPQNSDSVVWCPQRPVSPHWGPLVWIDVQSLLPPSWPSEHDKCLSLNFISCNKSSGATTKEKKVLLIMISAFSSFIEKTRKGRTLPEEGVSQLQWGTRWGGLWPPVTCTACSVSGSHPASLAPQSTKSLPSEKKDER